MSSSLNNSASSSDLRSPAPINEVSQLRELVLTLQKQSEEMSSKLAHLENKMHELEEVSGHDRMQVANGFQYQAKAISKIMQSQEIPDPEFNKPLHDRAMELTQSRSHRNAKQQNPIRESLMQSNALALQTSAHPVAQNLRESGMVPQLAPKLQESLRQSQLRQSMANPNSLTSSNFSKPKAKPKPTTMKLELGHFSCVNCPHKLAVFVNEQGVAACHACSSGVEVGPVSGSAAPKKEEDEAVDDFEPDEGMDIPDPIVEHKHEKILDERPLFKLPINCILHHPSTPPLAVAITLALIRHDRVTFRPCSLQGVRLVLDSGHTLIGSAAICRWLARSSGLEELYDDSDVVAGGPTEQTISWALELQARPDRYTFIMEQLEHLLATNGTIYAVSNTISVADIVMFETLEHIGADYTENEAISKWADDMLEYKEVLNARQHFKKPVTQGLTQQDKVSLQEEKKAQRADLRASAFSSTDAPAAAPSKKKQSKATSSGSSDEDAYVQRVMTDFNKTEAEARQLWQKFMPQ